MTAPLALAAWHLAAVAALAPDRAAVIIDDAVLTYGELDEASRAVAAMLHARGLRQGDVAAMLVGNSPAFFVIAWAAQRSGLYFLPIPTRLTAGEIGYILTDSGARVLFADQARLETAREAALGTAVAVLPAEDLPASTDLPEPALIEGADMLYTSGTTGRPKGVRRPITGQPLGSDDARLKRARSLFGLGGDSVFLSPAPLYHAAPLRFSMNLLRTGGTVVGLSKFDASAALAAIARHKVTHSQWVPTMFARLLALPEDRRASFDLSSHRVAIHAGAPCPPEIKQAMIAWWGPILHEYYSGTESVGFTHVTSQEWLERPGTVGRPYGCTVHILGEDGEELPAGRTGAVYFGGKGGLEYHGDPAKTAAAHDEQGRSTMGDIGHVDADGYLFLTDRKAFTIISGGVNVYPSEIEAVLVVHPAIADIAVFGVPDADLGETVFALVELHDPARAGESFADELVAYARDRLAGFKLPRRIAFGPVGRTETGKISKAALRERWTGRAESDSDGVCRPRY